MKELSPTAYVILGMLSWSPKSGYEIKALVDRSTRFFWAASYGQIYPELRLLADAGLIDAAEPEGGRRRTTYALTEAGREALAEWLARDPETYETRDEGLLKLFFAPPVPDATAVEVLEAKRRHHEDIVRRLREIQAGKDDDVKASPSLMVLRYGIETNEWLAQWCERAIAELSESTKDPKRGS